MKKTPLHEVFFPCFMYIVAARESSVKKHGVHVVTALWAKSNSRYTLLLEGYV